MCAALSCGYCGAETEFSILEEAQVLADQMKKLSSQELGVFTMQVNVEGEEEGWGKCSGAVSVWRLCVKKQKQKPKTTEIWFKEPKWR